MRALDTIQRVYRLTRPMPEDSSTRARASRATFALHDGARDVPAAVLFCIKPLPSTPPLLQGGSIFPAMQNFLLAARSVGLGACVTGWHVEAEDELREAVGIPDEWQLAALVVVGWPRGHHGPVRRRSVGGVVFFDQWDNTGGEAG